MNTQEIIQCLTSAATSAGLHKVTYDIGAFSAFLAEHRELVAYEENGVRKAGADLIKDAQWLLMNSLSLASLPKVTRLEKGWDREHVRGRYECHVDGCRFVYYPARRPSRLLVNFSGMGKDRYDRYSWYWDPTEVWDRDTAYLFFRDETNHYYLGTDEQPMSGTYSRLIRKFMMMNGLTAEQCFTAGSSMGGYAAIYYAVALGLGGCLSAMPQITQRATEAHEFANWRKYIKAMGDQWIDLDSFVLSKPRAPYVYLEYGNYPADALAVEALRRALDRRSGFHIIRKTDWETHTVASCFPVEVVSSVIQLFEAQRRNESVYAK